MVSITSISSRVIEHVDSLYVIARFGFVAESLARSLLSAEENVGRNDEAATRGRISVVGASLSEVHRTRT